MHDILHANIALTLKSALAGTSGRRGARERGGGSDAGQLPGGHGLCAAPPATGCSKVTALPAAHYSCIMP